MRSTTHALQVEQVSCADLSLFEGNARRGNVKAIKESLQVNGQYSPIVVNRGSEASQQMAVLRGNHTLRAARALGWATIAAVFVDVDDVAAKRIVLADNRLSDLADMDTDDLVALLQALDELDGTGYSADDLAELLGEEPVDLLTDPDDVPDVVEETVSVLGDVWQLGDHRLLVGDSTDPGSWAQIVDGDLDVVFTDPPYGVDYEGKTAEALKIDSDSLGEDGTRQLIADAFSVLPLKPGGAFYVCTPAVMELHFRLGMADAGLPARHSIAWVKDQFVLGRSDYHYRHESILYGWRKGGSHYFIDDRTQDSVWEVPRPRRSKEHPTMKPVELVERAIRNSSQLGDVVGDPFGGSGPTVIACQQLGRQARVIELDPRYADVICRRFQRATGVKPVRDDQPVDFG